MKIEINNDKYLVRSEAFLEWLEKWIENAVSAEDSIPKETKEDLVEQLVFNMASLLDGTGNLTCNGKVMIPHLGLQVDGEDAVIFDDGNLALHELRDIKGTEILKGQRY